MVVKELKGIIPAMVTLFKSDYSIDEKAIREHIDFLIEGEVNAILVLGSVGEFIHLTRDERKRVAEICVDQANDKIPIIVGAGSCSTDEVIDLTKHAKDIGADYVQLQAPFYFKYSDDVLYEHYKAIAEAVDIPLVIYNYPAAVGLDLSPRLIAELSKIPNIIGLKDTTTNLAHIQEVLHLTKEINKNFRVFAGSDDMLLPTLIIGGHGAVTGIGNFYPSLPVSLYKAYLNGDLKTAINLHNKIIELRYALMSICKPPPIPVFKQTLKLLGRNVEPVVRRPMLPLKENQIKQLKEILIKFDILE
ncbi:MAG: 4-hydroxy-tetrahydrodipicolinate synthase [Candidatus Methanomethylicaceae archaeon]